MNETVELYSGLKYNSYNNKPDDESSTKNQGGYK
jgi:hypothetical protein